MKFVNLVFVLAMTFLFQNSEIHGTHRKEKHPRKLGYLMAGVEQELLRIQNVMNDLGPLLLYEPGMKSYDDNGGNQKMVFVDDMDDLDGLKLRLYAATTIMPQLRSQARDYAKKQRINGNLELAEEIAEDLMQLDDKIKMCNKVLNRLEKRKISVDKRQNAGKQTGHEGSNSMEHEGSEPGESSLLSELDDSDHEHGQKDGGLGDMVPVVEHDEGHDHKAEQPPSLPGMAPVDGHLTPLQPGEMHQHDDDYDPIKLDPQDIDENHTHATDDGEPHLHEDAVTISIDDGHQHGPKPVATPPTKPKPEASGLGAAIKDVFIKIIKLKLEALNWIEKKISYLKELKIAFLNWLNNDKEGKKVSAHD